MSLPALTNSLVSRTPQAAAVVLFLVGLDGVLAANGGPHLLPWQVEALRYLAGGLLTLGAKDAVTKLGVNMISGRAATPEVIAAVERGAVRDSALIVQQAAAQAPAPVGAPAISAVVIPAAPIPTAPAEPITATDLLADDSAPPRPLFPEEHP